MPERNPLPLTEHRIGRAAPESRTRFLWDSKLAGFGVRIMPSGLKSYVVTFRAGNPPRQRRVTIGRVAEIGLKEARDLAASTKIETRLDAFDPVHFWRDLRDMRRDFDERLDGLTERVARLEGRGSGSPPE